MFWFVLIAFVLQGGVLFTSDAGDVAFVHPEAWEVTEDDSNEFFLEGEDIEVFIRVLSLDTLPELDEDLSPSAILDAQFEDDDYSSPEEVEISETREGAIIRADDEEIWTFLVDRDNYLLMFVTADEETRETYAEDIALIAESFTFGEGAVSLLEGTAEPEAESTEESTDDLASGTFEMTAGEITVSYPEGWEAVGNPDLGLLLAGEEELVIVVLDDLALLIDSLGLSGNPNQIFTATDITSVVRMGFGFGNYPIDEYDLDEYRVARLDFQDGDDGLAVLGVELDEETLLSVLIYGTPDQITEFSSTFDDIIESIEYEEAE